MSRCFFWAGVVLFFLLCRQYSFWAVFGWAYALATVILIIICFTPRRQSAKEAADAPSATVRAQCLEFETNE